ncbi:PhzF family phenazine biosynthesis protein [Glacieibacterium frigidum]|uniref:PhzF family phenazine biosynthesis protein n=1 Tax=Glacieibacterium frigidum TaxID=2593303 RepID=A0A552U786_9SPHN|nr:PhzF family phenazine biosynthesis protein [Glacieibacterium frigidum]TRW14080.1 PhzF family phenazine biosynthesis protein [Glacieibacterium frigidum]
MRLNFVQIDAFASRPFEGNPAAVMLLDAWLDDATLQAIAMEHNLAETAFLVARSNGEADYDLRWFTPTVEVAMCGHATLASGHFLLSRDPALAAVRFSTRKAGVLTVGRDGDRLTLSLPAWGPSPGPVAGLAEALGAVPEAILTRGDDYLVAVFATAAEVRALTPDFRAIAALTGGDVLCIATAPGDGDVSGGDVVSRAFAPGAGIDEDPVTGSAHAIIVPYWAERLGLDRFTAFQASTRGGHLDCTLAGDRVILGGTCVTVIEGVMHF